MSLVAAMGCLAMSANAAVVSINIDNHDFEVGSGTNVSSWDQDNTNGGSGVNTASPLPDGKALWINFTGVASQTTGTPIVEGTTYTLTVDLGQQTSWAADGGIIRLYGSDDLSLALAEFDTGNLPAGGDTLLNQTTSFVATAGQANGQFIGVALIGGASSGGTQVSFDNVRLDATAAAIPESSTTALLGLGGLALILRRRT